MSPEQLAEINPVKAVVGVVVVLGSMGIGAMLFNATTPPVEDLETVRIQKMQMEAMAEQQRVLDDMRYESFPSN